MGRVKELLDLHEGSTNEEIKRAMNRRAISLLNKEYRQGLRDGIVFQSCLVIIAYFIVNTLNNYIGG